jgi:hypothetical protein
MHESLRDSQSLNLRLNSTPCLVLSEVGSDATFAVARDASAVGIATVLLSYCKIKEEVFNHSLTSHVNLTMISVLILTMFTIWKLWPSAKL